jgi:son of sevenless
MDLDPIELARQLTLIECAAFCSIRPNELIGQRFNKQEYGLAPGIRAACNLNTKIASWMTTLVLSYEDPKHRAALLKYFIRVGEVCLQLHNFNTLMAVRSALDSSSISRLKRTWEQLGHKSKQSFDGMLKATDSSRNFGDYRNSLKQLVAPCLPFLGLYLTDLIFIDVSYRQL